MNWFLYSFILQFFKDQINDNTFEVFTTGVNFIKQYANYQTSVFKPVMDVAIGVSNCLSVLPQPIQLFMGVGMVVSLCFLFVRLILEVI